LNKKVLSFNYKLFIFRGRPEGCHLTASTV